MKEFYAGLFALAALGVLIVIHFVGKSDRKIERIVRKLLVAGFLAVLANIGIVLTTNKVLCVLSYSLFFVCMDWMLYYFMQFSYELTNFPISIFKNNFWYVLLSADSISMLANNFLFHAFDCHEISDKYGELLFKPVYYIPYQLHLLLCYILCAFIVIPLIYKAVKTAGIYRRKYFVLLAVFLVILIWDASYLLAADEAVNSSILGYVLGAITVYYYGAVYIPKDLLKQTITAAVKEMADGIFILDEDGKCMHANNKAKEMIEAVGWTFATIERDMESWRRRQCGPGNKNVEVTEMKEVEGEKKYFRILCHNMHDKKGRYTGCFVMIRNCTEEVVALEEERFRADHDDLTGLYNRQCFYREAEKIIQENPGETYVMVCSNVREFKLVNDIFGANAGDALLKNIAMRIDKWTTPGRVSARIGNDRFAILLKKSEYREETFRNQIMEIGHGAEERFSYSVQVYAGVYEIQDPTLPISVMCDRAFLAINTIKGQYDKTIAYYTDTLRNQVLWEQRLIGEIDSAIEGNQFLLYLQPQFSAAGRALGAEALVRWQHPTEGLMMPGRFIGVFEKSGLIAKLDQHMWELACKQLAVWQARGRDDFYISVNISPKDFYFCDVFETLEGLVEKYHVPKRNLKLEITETAVLANLRSQKDYVERLRKAGFIVEMDDFGSGYSSLNMLKDIRVDVLKIDMAFLGQTEDHARARVILEMIVGLSKQLGLPVIVEGVETATQLEFLRKIGCDMFQGYYFAKPMEVSSFEEKYV